MKIIQMNETREKKYKEKRLWEPRSWRETLSQPNDGWAKTDKSKELLIPVARFCFPFVLPYRALWWCGKRLSIVMGYLSTLPRSHSIWSFLCDSFQCFLFVVCRTHADELLVLLLPTDQPRKPFSCIKSSCCKTTSSVNLTVICLEL